MSRIRTANLVGALYANTLDVTLNIEANNITTTNGVNAAFMTIDSLKFDGDQISITTANANLALTANGTGVIKSNTALYIGVNAAAHLENKGYDKDSLTLVGFKDSNGAAEVVVTNKSNGTLAYAEFIALNDTANQEQGWISIGVNSSEYNDPDYTLTGPDDGYLLFEAPLNSSANGDLIIGTGSYGQNNRIIMAAGGFEPDDAQLKIFPAVVKTAEIIRTSLTSNVATFTTANTHTFIANDSVLIAGAGAPYNGQRFVTGVTANTFTMSITNSNIGQANLSPYGSATQILPFNKGTVELTAQLFVGENSRSIIENNDITLAQGHAIPVGIVVNNDGPGQTVMINDSNGTLAYSEFIAHNDAGNVEHGWISIGINSSGYDDPEFPITKADDGYILFEAPEGTTGDGDMIIGTGTFGSKNRIILAAEGFDEANAQMIITPNESVRISINTDSSSANTGALQVAGGVGVSGSLFVQGNQTIQGDLIVNGSQVIQSIASVSAAGPISLVGDGNQANTWDFGLVGTYAKSKSTTTHAITNKALANNSATITTANNHGFLVEDYVIVVDVDSTFNGTHRITSKTANTFTYFKLANNVTSTAATGNASVSSTATYTGVVKKATDGYWRLISNLGSRPEFNVDWNDANTIYDGLYAANAVFEGTVNANSFITTAGLNITNQANNAYAAANNRVLKAGDTMTGQLNISSGGLVVTGNSNFDAGTLFIDSAGDKVGIGTTSPAAPLSIFSSSTYGGSSSEQADTNPVFLLLRSTSGGGSRIDFGNSVKSDLAIIQLRVHDVGSGTYNDSSLTFSTSLDGSTSEKLRIRYDGNVGIGTTVPSYKLHVLGDVSANAFLGATYSQTSYSSNTSVFDTITTSGAGLYDVVIKTNPNSASASGTYVDWIYGKIVIGTGWSGSAVTDYIYFIQENPDPRSLYASGAGSITADVVFNVGGSEFNSLAQGSSYTIRIKTAGHTVDPSTYATVRLTKIG